LVQVQWQSQQHNLRFRCTTGKSMDDVCARREPVAVPGLN